MSQTANPPPTSLSEISIDGVRYARLESAGAPWRLAALPSNWREELPLLGSSPDIAKLKNLEDKNIYLNKGSAPRLAVMCCGLGSAWPGMGRELYDNFPAARAAMDSLAVLADWDLLSLMDEKDPEVLNHSRTQIPYLFMLEYAQWSQLLSLGLKPDLLCGHSLGELVALCLAGVYSPEAAWHLFETRSAHMASLEANPENETGMLAISADYEIVREILKSYPNLHISNCNTPKQFILGGDRESLLEVRKNLRKNRIPAFMLGINLAFHNPGMRVLRNLSYRRLNGLKMHPPAVPMLSCVTADLYPAEQREICSRITDLDENTVDWPKSVNAIHNGHGISHFLELGPQETLCGLVNEIFPDAKCFPVSRKGAETLAMRQLCARLYSLGLLDEKLINSRATVSLSVPHYTRNTMPPHTIQTSASFENASSEWETLARILSEETGRPVQEIGPELDLRYDLAIRSSRFPYLIQEAERRFNRQLPLEKLLQINTVGDLASLVAGIKGEENKDQASAPAHMPTERPSPFTIPPLASFKFISENASRLSVWHSNPDVPGLLRKLSGVICLCVLDYDLLPQIWAGLAPFDPDLVIPAETLEKCAPLGERGARLIPLAITQSSSPMDLVKALKDTSETAGAFQGLLFIPPPMSADNHEGWFAHNKPYFEILPELLALGEKGSWLCVMTRMRPNLSRKENPASFFNAADEFFRLCNSPFQASNAPHHSIFWLDEREFPSLQNLTEAGDMLARELLFASPKETIWLPSKQTGELFHSPIFCPSGLCMENIRQDSHVETAHVGRFSGECQFSIFAEPALAVHGACDRATPADFDGSPWLPLGHILKSLLLASRLTVPWLAPLVLSDVHIHNFPFLPYGITRECRLQADAGQWLMQEQALSRICHASMQARGLKANGRRDRAWIPVCDALCLMAPPTDKMADYHLPQLPDQNFSSVPDASLGDFYDALQFGEEWRFLHNFGKLNAKADSPGKVSIVKQPGWIAGTSEWEYNCFAFLADAIYQAVLFDLAQPQVKEQDRNALSASLQKWTCGYLGLVRFINDLDLFNDSFLLHFIRSWEDRHFARFDGIVHTTSGKPVMSFLNFEFYRAGHMSRKSHTKDWQPSA